MITLAALVALVEQYIPRDALHPGYQATSLAFPAHELAHFVLVGRDRRMSRLMGLEHETAAEQAAQEFAANVIAHALLCSAYTAERCHGDMDRAHRAHAGIVYEIATVDDGIAHLRSDPWVVARVRELLEATPWRPWWGIAEWRAECAL